MTDEVLQSSEDSGVGVAPTPETPTPAPTGGETTGGAPSAPTGGGEQRITMTPAQLAERLERAKSTEKVELLKTLGLDSVEALQAIVKDGKAALDAQKTEAERQAEALKQAAERLEQLQDEAEAAKLERDRALIREAAVSKMSGRFHDPSAAFRLLDGLPGTKLALEDGEVKGLDDAIEALAKLYPWTLVDARKSVAPKIGATNPDGTEVAPKETDAERRARYFGEHQTDFFRGGGMKPEINKKPK
jgi:hypothetical protein